MSGFGVQAEHGSYDEIAAQFAAAARRLAAPLALAARKKAMAARQETDRNTAQLSVRRGQFARDGQAQHQQHTLRVRTVTAARLVGPQR